MTRRFLTSDDVRRAGGPEIVVDAATVVTPQALETAAAAGVTIRTADGAWTPPPPDRGPDAAAARRHLPHLPEPEGGRSDVQVAVATAVGTNRAGVLAEITAAIAEAGGNVHDVSQRVIDGYFHLIVSVEVPSGVDFGGLKQRLECLGGPEDYAVHVMNEKVFRFMHRV